MFSIFKNKSSLNLHDSDQLAKYKADIISNLEKRLNNSQKVYDFIIKDIYGAAQGDYIFQQLVQFSGLFEVEYLQALHSDSTMDEHDSALDYLNNQIIPVLISQLGLECAIVVRCNIVKKIIVKYRQKLDETRLEIAKQKYNTNKKHLISRDNKNQWAEIIELLGQ